MLITACSEPAHQIDFKKIRLPKSPNYYLMCPVSYCNVKQNAISPVFAVPVEKLAQFWQQMIIKQARTKLVAQNRTTHQYTYIQRSRLFHFPDTINVKLIALPNRQSTIAIYSRSKYGYGDLGVNEKRVQHWIKQLQTLAT